ncbi:hypothetical protein LOCC1_G002690 [Lachnellula occidentalis]|uniref:Indole-diterpene biosynthesis protein PaxU n=1 Tax=Lachnellula occidentalis TaxID=215460 RepID=A0A8H8S371_9HELO|nr:hypothetical protein LOCC1_G002690 [Lachnellula occidentalis]
MSTNNATASDLEFTRLNPLVSLYTPPDASATASSSNTDPTTIIFFQWMGVGPKSRYLKSFYSHYHALYPRARIIAVQSLMEFFIYTSNETRQNLVKPVVAAINSDPAPEPRTLVHLVSNGGSVGFTDVCHVYKEETGHVLPVKAIVLDSSPGESSFITAFHAFATALPKGLLWYPGAALMVMWLGPWAALHAVFGRQHILDKARMYLNDWTVVDKDACRLYVYSVVDKLVSPRPVEQNAREAEAQVVDVRLLKEEDIPHVQAMMRDTERYWKMVSELWDRASSR